MAEATRLGALAAQAFADRRLIDWRALHRRAHVHADRLFVANLQAIAAIRGAAAEAPGRESAAPPVLIGLVTLVAVTAALETLIALAIAAIALIDADPIDVSLPQIELALAFGLAGALLATAVRRDRRSLFLLAAFLTASSAFAHTALLDLAWADASPWMRAIDGCATDAFTPACLMLFAVDFPRVHRFTRFDVLARRACLAAWVVGGVFFLANLAIDARLVGAALSPLYREHPDHVFWHVFALGLVLPVVSILLRARRAPAAERLKVVRVAAAIGLGSAPFLVAGMLRIASADPDRLLAMSGIDARWFGTLVMAGFMAIPVLSSCAVLVDRPFDMGALRSGAARLARSLRRRSRRPRRDPHREAPTAIERLRSARGVRELEARLAQELGRSIGASRTRLFLRHGDRWESTDARIVDLPGDSAIVAMLDAGASLVDLARTGATWPLLPHGDRRWARSCGVMLAAAVGHRDGAVVAIVAVDGRTDRTAFEERDRWFVAALAPAVAAMWSASADRSRIAQDTLTPGDAIDAAFECPRCGEVSGTRTLACGCGAPPALAALPVLVADKFLVQRCLGRGGMGIVYLARDVALDRDVVLKTLPAPGRARVAGLRREARAMAAIRHEALATIHGLEIWRDTPVLVVEHFPCGTLADRLRAGPLPSAQALRLALDLASALTHMHAHGLLHRDLKPANIALTDAGAARLLDFGIAVLMPGANGVARSAAGGDAQAAGTPAYTAPETYEGAELAPHCDLWSLSIVTIEALTGSLPIRPRSRRGVGATRWPFEIDMTGLAATLEAIDSALVPFFRRALAVDPGDRHPHAQEWREALAAIVARLPPGP